MDHVGIGSDFDGITDAAGGARGRLQLSPALRRADPPRLERRRPQEAGGAEPAAGLPTRPRRRPRGCRRRASRLPRPSRSWMGPYGPRPDAPSDHQERKGDGEGREEEPLQGVVQVRTLVHRRRNEPPWKARQRRVGCLPDRDGQNRIGQAVAERGDVQARPGRSALSRPAASRPPDSSRRARPVTRTSPGSSNVAGVRRHRIGRRDEPPLHHHRRVAPGQPQRRHEVDSGDTLKRSPSQQRCRARGRTGRRPSPSARPARVGRGERRSRQRHDGSGPRGEQTTGWSRAARRADAAARSRAGRTPRPREDRVPCKRGAGSGT